jgi:glycosyltransferase involved in cell wall biosynthesis
VPGPDAPLPAAGNAIAIVVKGYPRLSETFIANEIRALERRGLRLLLYSLRRPTDPYVHPVHTQITAPVVYLPEYLHDWPLRLVRAWWRVRRRPGYRTARTCWLRDLRRDPTRNRVRRFGQALVLASELAPEVSWLHAHFLHTPASVTRYAALVAGLPWSVSAHAKDVWTIPEWEVREKLGSCRWLVTCTAYNARHLQSLAVDPATISLIHHGLDRTLFPPADRAAGAADGTAAHDPVVILSVGRAVEKKGFDVLLDALALLPGQCRWRLVHLGGGPLLPRLQARARTLGLAGRITWRGARAQADVLAAYRAADLFALACRIGRDGDRDGLPNVLMEAQSQGVACVASAVSAIPELIVDGETGLLVPPDDPRALAGALGRLIADPGLRARLGRAGQAHVFARFSFEAGIERLAARFRAVERPVVAA